MQNNTKDWDELLRRFGPEDPQVIESLVDHYEQYIYHLACAILNDSDGAKDVTQMTFIHASRKLSQYQPGTNIKGWLYTIAVNNARGTLRKSKSRKNMRRAVKMLSLHRPSQPSPEKQHLRGEQKTELWAAVDQLGEKHRIPIILRFNENLSVKEISKILSVKQKTVYSRLHHGFRKLRKLMQEEATLFPKGEVR